MRRLGPADYRVMPWKNGGGTTTEIAIFPEDSGVSGKPFVWRVSIADVAADGPFSRFPGYDRHIMVIAGNGMQLDAGEHGLVDLSSPFVPQSFSGDWDVQGRLIDGPVRDFNLMADRHAAKSSLDVVDIDGPARFAADGGAVIVHVLDGEGIASGHVLATGDTLLLDSAEQVEFSPLAVAVHLAVARVRPSR